MCLCRCCQSCLEDLYWNCCEEKFCYDETIAYYNPEDDEYYQKQPTNGVAATGIGAENNNSPIVVQPNRLDRNPSMMNKIHMANTREIQTNVSMLAPEIISVFANSQIFHDNAPAAKVAKSNKYGTPGVHKRLNQTDQDKLLDRLEGRSSPTSTTTEESSPRGVRAPGTITTITIDPSPSLNSSRQNILSIDEEEEHHDAINKANVQQYSRETDPPPDQAFLRPKPYFEFRPRSETDIFTISRNFNSFSMTPEIPSVSFNNLPKKYLETPKIEEFRESTSLYQLQTAQSAMVLEYQEMAMPRYYRKSDLVIPAKAHVQSAENVSVPMRVEKSKRLRGIRSNLPPLQISEATRKY